MRSPGPADQLVAAVAPGAPAEVHPHEVLSPRELLVLRRVALGRTMKEAALERGLGENTAATCHARIVEKTGLKTAVELPRYAMKHQLTDEPPSGRCRRITRQRQLPASDRRSGGTAD